jgi:hypothetical protein
MFGWFRIRGSARAPVGLGTAIAWVAQSVEQRTRNAQVRSSNLLSGSSSEAIFGLAQPSDRTLREVSMFWGTLGALEWQRVIGAVSDFWRVLGRRAGSALPRPVHA